ncbi:integral membrane mpv17 pmp22 [Pyrrhoderma noxium]|uniref:Integral membrane mpv17 pmp22 n=1 Tax=Pyrrhoderma noxium TaxID=2282107 RepID=A0A286UQ19_9AGAM|nr:integral membrane mpv17 pmp22 [Pyrrhoderma noxium]
MASLLKAYNALLQRRPMAAQSVTAGILFGAGDVIAQQAIEKKGKEHDFARTARLTFYGGALFGPIMTKWYQALNKLKFSSPTKAVVYRVWLDQAVLTPVAVVFFFSSMTFLEGKGISEAKKRVENAYVPTLIRNWGVFIPAQIVNFALVPTHMRFVFVGVVSLFWNTYLSYANVQAQHALLLQANEKSEADKEQVLTN